MKSGSICEKLEGKTVDGKFPLLEWVGGWANRCVFLTVRQGMQTANIKVILASGSDADAYLAKWEAARELSHPALVQMMETGRSAIDDKELVFVVTEKADTFLSEIIPRKALDSDKMADILDPIVDALCFLHGKGLVHGQVRPSNIVQVADQWKLSADELVTAGELKKLSGEPGPYDAPEAATGNFTPAADVWSLGTIVVEAFAQRTPAWDPASKTEAEIPDSLPEPFLEIARRCLRWDPGERCSITEVKTLVLRHKSPVGAKKFYSATTTEPAAAGPRIEGASAATEPLIKSAVARPISAVARPIPTEEAPREEPEKPTAEPSYPFGKVEPDELAPRSRLFADIDEEEERKSHVGLILLGILVLLGAGGYVAVRQHWINLPWPPQTQSAPAANQPAPQTQAPEVPQAESPGAPPAGQTAAPTQTPPETQSAGATGPPTPEAQPSAPPSAEKPAPPSAEEPKTAKKESKEAPKGESAPKEESGTPPVANAEGAVLKRVLPNVSSGAVQSMRGPVEVEIRVSVSEDGAVSNAEYMTHGPGNYFARIAHDAAKSWKFKPPQSEGQPQASVWNLRFRFERRNTEVTATEVR
jgi:outer membrane biosynthesis protein TonB